MCLFHSRYFLTYNRHKTIKQQELVEAKDDKKTGQVQVWLVHRGFRTNFHLIPSLLIGPVGMYGAGYK